MPEDNDIAKTIPPFFTTLKGLVTSYPLQTIAVFIGAIGLMLQISSTRAIVKSLEPVSRRKGR